MLKCSHVSSDKRDKLANMLPDVPPKKRGQPRSILSLSPFLLYEERKECCIAFICEETFGKKTKAAAPEYRRQTVAERTLLTSGYILYPAKGAA